MNSYFAWVENGLAKVERETTDGKLYLINVNKNRAKEYNIINYKNKIIESEMDTVANNFDLSQFDEYREDNRREVKKANGGLPISLWDTYSAFANCYGGGIMAISEEDGKLHPTAAGMLMFGDEYNIVRHFPEYFLDYREELEPTTRWSDRLQSSSGEWSGNVCDFYFRVYNKIIKDVKVPFKMSGGERIDDTPVHKALREALANCLINADYHGLRGVVIRKEPNKLVLANPGYVRTGKKQMRIGGESDPRNKALMKMFNLINIGERAGSGVPNIFNIWADEGWEEPIIEERFDPDRTVLSLPFVKKATEKSDRKTITKKSELQIQSILEYMDGERWYKANELTKILGLKDTRTKELLRKMVIMNLLEDNGATKGKTYRKR